MIVARVLASSRAPRRIDRRHQIVGGDPFELESFCLTHGGLESLGNHHEVSSLGMDGPEGDQIPQVRLQGAPFAFVGIHRVARPRHHEIHLALLVIAPEEHLGRIFHAEQGVEHPVRTARAEGRPRASGP